MFSVKRVFASLVLLIGFLPATGQTQVLDKKVLTAREADRVMAVAIDNALEVTGANSQEGAPAASSSSRVIYFDSKQVAAHVVPDSGVGRGALRSNFKKGTLVNWNDGEQRFSARVTRLDKGTGSASHAFTNIYYILRGNLTMVTGGTLVDPKTTEPITPWGGQDIYGTAIEGGETRHLAKGDVLILPKGVPHWFKAVQNPPAVFFVVNVR